MSDNKTFDLIVEAAAGEPHFLHLTELVWNEESPPDIVVLEDGVLLVKVGRYAAPGNQYRYRVAVVSHLIKGKPGYGSRLS